MTVLANMTSQQRAEFAAAINAVGGDPTARTSIAALQASVSDILARLEVLENPTYPPYVPPAATNDALPALTSSGATYYEVESTERLLSSYSGALVRADNNGADGADLGSGNPRLTSNDLPTPVTNGRILFDQSGGNRFSSQSTTVNQPKLRADVLVGQRLGIAFDSMPSPPGASNPPPPVFVGKNDLDLTNRSQSEFFVIDPSYSVAGAMYSEMATAAGDIDRLFYTQNPDQASPAPSGSQNIATAAGRAPVVMPAQPIVIGLVEKVGEFAIWLNGTKTVVGTSSSGNTNSVTIARKILGKYTPDNSLNGNFKLGARVSVKGELNDTDAAAISSALLARFGIPAAFDVNIVHMGDSIVQGAASTYCRNQKHYFLPLLSKSRRYINFGIGGRKLTDIYRDRLVYEGTQFIAGKTNIAIVDAGINDMAFSVSQGNTDAETEGARIYGVLTQEVTYLKGLGFKVGVTTTLPTTIHPASVNAIRENFNVKVRAGKAGADFLIDRAAESHMGVYPTSADDPSLYPDKIHPSSLGYSYLGPVYAKAINKAIA